MKRKANQIEHSIDFTPKQWEGICSFSFEPFDIGEGEAMTRGQWLAVTQMALGKSVMLAEGRYDLGDEDDTDNEQWADELREIADTILAEFKPGDGEDQAAPRRLPGMLIGDETAPNWVKHWREPFTITVSETP